MKFHFLSQGSFENYLWFKKNRCIILNFSVFKNISKRSNSNFRENLTVEYCHSNEIFRILTFSLHTEYVKRESIEIAWVKKKFSPFDKCSWFICLRRQNESKKMFVCLSVWMYVRTWTFHVDTITFGAVEIGL